MRIAILFSGIIRGGSPFTSSFNYLIESLSTKGFLVDCFFHTWDEEEVYSPGGQSTLTRRLPKYIFNKLPNKVAGLNEFSNYAPEISKVFEGRYTKPLEIKSIDWIANLKEISIQNQDEVLKEIGDKVDLETFEFKGVLNQVLMFYSFFESYKLMLSSGYDYDYVIKIRPDIKIKKVNCDAIYQLTESFCLNTVNITHEGKGCGDILFHGVPGVVKPILELWDVMMEKKKPFYDTNGKAIFAERLLSYSLKRAGVKFIKSNAIVSTFPAQLSEYVPWLPPCENIADAVKKDFGSKPPGWCVDLINSACACRNL